MTIASEFAVLAATKTAIKTAIEAKGVVMTGVPFINYSLKIDEIVVGGNNGSGDNDNNSGYVRPADWLPLPSFVNGEQKMVALVAVFPGGSAIALAAEAAYTVDWGDGVVENFAANATAYHKYNYDNPLFNNTDCDRGYKQSILKVKPQAGNNLNSLNLHKKIQNTPVYHTQTSIYLDIAVGGPSLHTFILRDSVTSYVANHCLLEQVRLYENVITSFASFFYYCTALASVPVLHTSSGVNFTGMFSYCSVLTEVPLFDTSLGTSFSSMFSNCNALKTIPLLNTSSGTNFSNFAMNCTSLAVFPAIDTAKSTTFENIFSGCQKLITLPILNTELVTNYSGAFSYAISLIEIPAWNMSAGISFNFTFNGCNNIRRSLAVGISASHEYSNSIMNGNALDEIYTNLAVASGVALSMSGMSAAVNSSNKNIATSKGWSIYG